ncbi:hypothetical protein RFI_34673 [Reticulomyxa filosa]|uniref:Uncharacterized protein n=1 Tax=Reticulomyxa filosa TaxID=46433 RepID=X6LPS0_RETFI|nr:hypothetical protein RFI_34673 [Reticulomyxa filosa]|eukprot:ETO02740.1 hypothetical protein RFI_34673 [Reticulomyxa filosa]
MNKSPQGIDHKILKKGILRLSVDELFINKIYNLMDVDSSNNDDECISKEDLFKIFSSSLMIKIADTMKELINVFVDRIFDNVLLFNLVAAIMTRISSHIFIGFVILFCQKKYDYLTQCIIKYLKRDKRHKDVWELF